MTKTYNFLFNSANKISGATNNDCIFNINWGFLPKDKKFKGGFNFHSEDITNLLADDITKVNLFIDGTPSTYEANGGTNYQTSYCIGIVHPMLISATGANKSILQTDFQDNPPFYLQSTPSNNQVRVQLTYLDGTTLNKIFAGEYLLILHLEEVD